MLRVQTLKTIRMTVGTVGNGTKPKANPFGLRDNSPIEKQGSHDPNPNELGVRTNIDPLEEEQQNLLLEWIGWVRWDSIVKISKSLVSTANN